eukprot:NODE_794_length_3854_cov_0.407082.p1 type:complete len:483 gc:universal NODE_794_length_3854_cov_0.407082:1959-3407(+)
MFDCIVIGAGSGGLAASRRIASYGKKVAVIEKYRPGGTCVIRGCVPKKMTYNLANLVDNFHHHFPRYSINSSLNSVNYSNFKNHRDEYINKLENIYRNNLRKDGVELIEGLALFHDQSISNEQFSIKVIANNQEQELKAKKIIIACGTKPHLPEITGSDLGITSDEFFLMSYIPKNIVIVGGGYIAVEIAGMLNSLGSNVTLIVRSTILRSFDEMIQQQVAKNISKSGIKIVHGTVEEIRGSLQKPRTFEKGNNLSVKFSNSSTVENVDEVLFAIGRVPDTEKLGLNYLKELNLEDGFVQTNELQETNIPGIFAIGDITGHDMLTPVAIKAGRTLGDRIFGGKNTKVDYSMVPSVVFSHPPVGSCGLSESEAVEKYGKDNVSCYVSTFVNLFDSPYNHLPIPEAMGYQGNLEKQFTKYKLVCKGATEQVVGLHMVGEASDEILQGFAVAMRMGATKQDFDDTIAIHPTAAEELVTMPLKAKI